MELLKNHQGPRKIFIADSSQISVSRVINLLSLCPNVEVVGYGQDANSILTGIAEQKPDVLILDIEMRGMSGVQFLRLLKKQHPQLIIIVLTNASHDQYRRRCLDVGADYFFDKASEFWKVNDILSPFPSSPYQV